MTQTVFTNDGVAHAFAARNQDQGRSNNGNLYFYGETLFSYGKHFPICRFYGETLLFSTDSYSVSTSKHMTIAERATTQFEKLYIPNLSRVCQIMDSSDKATRVRIAFELINEYAREIESLESKMARMRAQWKINATRGEISTIEKAGYFVWVSLCKRRGNPFNVASKKAKADKLASVKRGFTYDREQMNKAIAIDVAAKIELFDNAKTKAMESGETYAFNRFIENVQRDVSNWHVDAIGPLAHKTARRVMGVQWYKETIELQEIRNAKLAPLMEYYTAIVAERDSQIKAMNAEKIAAWLNGDSVRLPHGLPMILRVKGETLETSHGASVPLTDARKLTRAASLCRKTGKAWKRNGETKAVGMFQTDRITANGDLIVGCHNIPWKAIVECVERFVPDMRDVVA